MGVKAFRLPWLWVAVWLGLLGWTAVVSLGAPMSGPDVPASDKWMHLLTYAGLALVAVQVFRPGRALLLAALVTVLLGIGLEVAQATLTDDRRGDWLDALANTAGVLLGTASARLSARDALLRLERRGAVPSSP